MAFSSVTLGDGSDVSFAHRRKELEMKRDILITLGEKETRKIKPVLVIKALLRIVKSFFSFIVDVWKITKTHP